MTTELKEALKNEAKEVTNKVKNVGEKTAEKAKDLGKGFKNGFNEASEKTNELAKSMKNKLAKKPKAEGTLNAADMVIAIAESNISDEVKKEIIMFITNHRK